KALASEKDIEDFAMKTQLTSLPLLCDAAHRLRFLVLADGRRDVKEDSDLPINPPLAQRQPRLKFSGKRQLTRLPVVPLSTVKRAREQHNVTLNDIVMAAATGAIRRYCIYKGDMKLKESKAVECKCVVMLALPRECDIANPSIALQNKMLFSSVRLPVQEGNRAGRVKKMAAACSDLKSLAYMTGLKLFSNLTSMSPRAFLTKATGETWSKHSFLITNVPCTTGPLTWPAENGEVLKGITMVIANVMTQISVISYNGNLYASMIADPEIIDEAESVTFTCVSL
ncbi:Putative diacyglycerol O-acyltransferase MT1809 (Putative triacylglycerol synthase MT1809), partial [Durusdinium trenchii]